MFIDEIDIFVKGGDGGAGCVSFRREKLRARAAVPTAATGATAAACGSRPIPRLTTLLDFHYRRHYHAERGTHGQGATATAPSGDDLDPAGAARHRGPATATRATPVGDLDDRAASGCSRCRGTRGGRGNARFATVDQPGPAPRRPRTTRARALAPSRAEAPGRRRRDRLSQRRQVDAGLARVGGQAQDRRLPVHHAGALARHRARGRRADVRDRRSARAHPRRRRGQGARAPVPAPHRAHAPARCTCSTSIPQTGRDPLDDLHVDRRRARRVLGGAGRAAADRRGQQGRSRSDGDAEAAAALERLAAALRARRACACSTRSRRATGLCGADPEPRSPGAGWREPSWRGVRDGRAPSS